MPPRNVRPENPPAPDKGAGAPETTTPVVPVESQASPASESGVRQGNQGEGSQPEAPLQVKEFNETTGTEPVSSDPLVDEATREPVVEGEGEETDDEAEKLDNEQEEDPNKDNTPEEEKERLEEEQEEMEVELKDKDLKAGQEIIVQESIEDIQGGRYYIHDIQGRGLTIATGGGERKFITNSQYNESCKIANR